MVVPGALDQAQEMLVTTDDRVSKEPAGEAPPRCKRFPVEIEVTLTSESNFYTGFTENLSEGGLFVATYDFSPVGSKIEFNFSLPGVGRTIQGNGFVRWIREYNATNEEVMPGMGIQFDSIAEEHFAAIEAFIVTRETLFYTDL